MASLVGTAQWVPIDFNSATCDRFEQIGQGGFATVFRSSIGGFTVAEKVVSLVGISPSNLESFMQEVMLVRQLAHANIVRYLGHAVHGDELSLYVEYHRCSLHALLSQRIERAPSIAHALADNDPAEVRHVALQIANAIHYLHHVATPPVIHRDVKASNILISKPDHGSVTQWRVCLTDFGVSVLCPNELSAYALIGTPASMAPEMTTATKERPYTEKIDST